MFGPYISVVIGSKCCYHCCSIWTPTRLLYLTVSDFGVAVSVGGEDAPQRSDAGGVLEGRVVRQRAVKVSLDLLRGQAALAHRLLHQVAVVALMGLQLRGSIYTKRTQGYR